MAYGKVSTSNNYKKSSPKKSERSDKRITRNTSADKSETKYRKRDSNEVSNSKFTKKEYSDKPSGYKDRNEGSSTKKYKTQDSSHKKNVNRTNPTNKRSVVKSAENPRMESEEIRLNKYIADSGVVSRRKADDMIASGKVKINGTVVTELGTKVQRTDTVSIDGDVIKSKLHNVYIILNKPKDIITTTSDEKSRKTVMDIVHSHYRIYPVGRLDRNTTGVLLLTNDGEFANRLTHPKYQIERVYNIGLDKELKIADATAISHGVELEENEFTSPCELFIHPDDRTKVSIVLTEGKNREIRRIFEKFGYEVKKLDRKMFAGLTTQGINRGEFRHLTKEELLALKKLLKMR